MCFSRTEYVSIVSVKLKNGSVYERVMLLYPNFVIAVAGKKKLPFKPSEVTNVSQAKSAERKLKDSNWHFWYDPNHLV